MRVLIVDDEPLARRGLRNELTTIPDVDCVGECETCDAAVAAISSLAPDLVLLDVKLGRTTGFDALSRLDRDAMPLVVFVSAYDRHALAAFDVRAVDYVLKPVDPARLRAAIDRARETLALRRAATLGDRLEQLLARTSQEADDAAEGAPKMSGRIAIPDGNRVSFVDVAAIDWIEARGNYVRIHTGARPYLLRTPLRDIGNRLRAEAARGAGPGFVQVRRSALVNTAAIVAIERFSKGMYSITLRSGVRITSSRRHREGIRDLIESPGREAPARERS